MDVTMSGNIEVVEVGLNLNAHSADGDKRSKFQWNDDVVSLFLTLFIQKQGNHKNLSTNKLLELVSKDMLEVGGYELSKLQLKNKLTALRGEYVKIQSHNSQSGNDPFEEPPYFHLLVEAFAKKHNAVPPVISSSDTGTIVNVKQTPPPTQKEKPTTTATDEEDEPETPESEENEDMYRETAGGSKKRKKKYAKDKKDKRRIRGTEKALMEVNGNLSSFKSYVEKRQDESFKLLKTDIENAENYRQESLRLKREKLEILKKLFSE